MRQKIVLSVRKRMTGFSHRKSDTGQKNRSKSLHPFDHDKKQGTPQGFVSPKDNKKLHSCV